MIVGADRNAVAAMSLENVIDKLECGDEGAKLLSFVDGDACVASTPGIERVVAIIAPTEVIGVSKREKLGPSNKDDVGENADAEKLVSLVSSVEDDPDVELMESKSSDAEEVGVAAEIMEDGVNVEVKDSGDDARADCGFDADAVTEGTTRVVTVNDVALGWSLREAANVGLWSSREIVTEVSKAVEGAASVIVAVDIARDCVVVPEDALVVAAPSCVVRDDLGMNLTESGELISEVPTTVEGATNWAIRVSSVDSADVKRYPSTEVASGTGVPDGKAPVDAPASSELRLVVDMTIWKVDVTEESDSLSKGEGESVADGVAAEEYEPLSEGEGGSVADGVVAEESEPLSEGVSESVADVVVWKVDVAEETEPLSKGEGESIASNAVDSVMPLVTALSCVFDG